jgi:hypothetical protein
VIQCQSRDRKGAFSQTLPYGRGSESSYRLCEPGELLSCPLATGPPPILIGSLHNRQSTTLFRCSSSTSMNLRHFGLGHWIAKTIFVRCSLFVVRCSLFVVRCSLFVVRCSLSASVQCYPTQGFRHGNEQRTTNHEQVIEYSNS